jgi:hypothetical protein
MGELRFRIMEVIEGVEGPTEIQRSPIEFQRSLLGKVAEEIATATTVEKRKLLGDRVHDTFDKDEILKMVNRAILRVYQEIKRETVKL